LGLEWDSNGGFIATKFCSLRGIHETKTESGKAEREERRERRDTHAGTTYTGTTTGTTHAHMYTAGVNHVKTLVQHFVHHAASVRHELAKVCFV
jgi:hypothetical protein